MPPTLGRNFGGVCSGFAGLLGALPANVLLCLEPVSGPEEHKYMYLADERQGELL